MRSPSSFAEHLVRIEHDLLEMASRAELMVTRAADALARMDIGLAEQVIRSDDKVDSLDLQIEKNCLDLLSQQHPEGADLRMVGTILKIITDIERVGDLAVDIARCTLSIEGEMGTAEGIDIPRIALLARTVFHLAIEAYVRQDEALVQQVDAVEQEVDALYKDLMNQIRELMRAHPEQAVPLGSLLLAINHLERVADHGHNISERVAFVITGEMRTHQVKTA